MKKVYYSFVLVLIFGCGFYLTGLDSVQATDYVSPEVKIFKRSGKMKRGFLAFEESFRGGGFVATGNIKGRRRFDEIIVGAGPGGGPRIKVFNHKGKQTKIDFMAFESDFRGGVDVVVGNIDGKGRDEIIVVKASDGHAKVKIFRKNKKIREFLALSPNHTSGASIACGDVDGDGKDEIIIGSGIGAKAHVKVFNGKGKFTGQIFWPFESNFRGGVDVAVGNIDGGAKEEIVVSKAKFSNARIKVYKTGKGQRILGEFDAFSASRQEGANIDCGDIDHDGVDEVIVGANGLTSEVRVYEGHGKKMDFKIVPYGTNFRGGSKVALGKFGKVRRKKAEKKGFKTRKIYRAVTIPGRKYYDGRNEYRYIEISIPQQKLFIYEKGKKIKEMLVSTGTSKYSTPIGDFKIYYKVKSQRMRHEYGPDHPDNYDLPDVPNVLAFNGPYTIHGTYWHSNFGYQMSHGCVNLSPADAFWIYHWANVGDVVYVTPW